MAAASATCPPPDNYRLYTHAILRLNLVSYNRFFPNFHLTVIQSLNPCESQLLLSCIMSQINTLSHGIPILRKSQTRDRQTDGQADGMQHFIAPIQVYFDRCRDARSLLVLRAVRRRRSAIHLILAIFN